MSIELLQILDPEIVSPSVDSAPNPRFWRRMLAWSTATEMRIGPESLKALYRLSADLARVTGMADHDLWGIIGRFASRAIEGGSQRHICPGHVEDTYVPEFGDQGNVALLLSDLGSLDPALRVALGTSSACWPAVWPSECEECSVSRISLVDECAQPVHDHQISRIWREAYLEAAAGDFVWLETNCQLLFPNLEFSPTAWTAVKTLSQPPPQAAASVVGHLSVLNDSALDIWKRTTTVGDRQAELGSLGVVASREGPRTHRNSSAMAARDFEFSLGLVRCEWHTKILPHTDRIHFAIADGGVRVGAIVDHLPL